MGKGVASVSNTIQDGQRYLDERTASCLGLAREASCVIAAIDRRVFITSEFPLFRRPLVRACSYKNLHLLLPKCNRTDPEAESEQHAASDTFVFNFLLRGCPFPVPQPSTLPDPKTAAGEGFPASNRATVSGSTINSISACRVLSRGGSDRTAHARSVFFVNPGGFLFCRATGRLAGQVN